MENNMTEMVLRLLLTAMEEMGKDTDPETLAKFLNTTTEDIGGDLEKAQPETQQFCQFGFKEAYRGWHYRLALSVAVTGVATNLLNMVTLTRPSMATPTNLLLLGLTVADLMVVTEYIPYAASMLVGGGRLVEAREYALYIITHAHLSQIAIWLTVSLALWRWVVVCRPHAAVTLCTTPRARRLLLAVYLACPLVSVPTFFLYTVKEITISDGDSSKIYIVDMSSNKLLKEMTLLVYSVAVKLVPCLLITLLIPTIIHGMWVAKRRRQRLMKRSCTPAAVTVAATAAAPATCRAAMMQEPEGDGLRKAQDCVSIYNGNADPAAAANKRSCKYVPQLQRRDTLAAFKSFYAKATQLAAFSTPSQRQTGATERSTSMLLLMMALFLLAEAPQGILTGMALFYGHKFFRSECSVLTAARTTFTTIVLTSTSSSAFITQMSWLCTTPLGD
ncbi:Sex peptide receptor [Chionoecetes opilio]|uniref:Sex peptide receptor n=1 Tax=Chionoecetes opilio TaxID=41210 RepID=A0A8J5CRK6_CHIOP|nr:Sex peptide receptor [Chionoecetes opilio]